MKLHTGKTLVLGTASILATVMSLSAMASVNTVNASDTQLKLNITPVGSVQSGSYLACSFGACTQGTYSNLQEGKSFTVTLDKSKLKELKQNGLPVSPLSFYAGSDPTQSSRSGLLSFDAKQLLKAFKGVPKSGNTKTLDYTCTYTKQGGHVAWGYTVSCSQT